MPVAAGAPLLEWWDRPALSTRILLSLPALQLFQQLVEPVGHALRMLAGRNPDRI
jgi:hypothetical protein